MWLSFFSLNVPVEQSAQVASSADVDPAMYPLPGPHVTNECEMHVVCPAISEYLPAPHVTHNAEPSMSVEYLPLAHGEQDTSTKTVPAAMPWPLGQFGTLCGTHALSSSAELNLPTAQLEQDASSSVVDPAEE